MITKYHALTNAELLRLIEDKRNSPVIDELAQRLEKCPEPLEDNQHIVSTMDNFTCPCCEARVSFNQEGKLV